MTCTLTPFPSGYERSHVPFTGLSDSNRRNPAVNTRNEADLWRNDGEVLLSRRPLVQVIHVARFFHNVTGSVVEVRVSFGFF